MIAAGAGLLAAATLAAYWNSFPVPWQFDDEFAIPGNASLLHWSTFLSPPPGTTVGGRPFLNASFGLNHALGGFDVAGFHGVNLLIHLFAGLTLWGIVTRTLRTLERPAADSSRLGFIVALLWTLHPLQTESVTYLSQRAESLMGLWYLLTLYTFIRGAASPRPAIWWMASGLCCLLGMGTKEVMVSAPLMVLLYDRTFLAGSFAAAWKMRRGLYGGLAATWLPLLYWVFKLGGNRGGSTGFGSGISVGAYLLTQFTAIAHYLRLVIWPHPLVFEYGPLAAVSPFVLALQILLTLGLLMLTVGGFVRRSPWAFFGAWFFALLAPTSLVPGALQQIAEHRMYLASAAVIGALVLGGDAALARLGFTRPRAAWTGGLLVVGLAAGWGILTARRNNDYRSPLALWADTVAKRPDHAQARYNLANELAKQRNGADEAIRQYEAALQLNPRLALAEYNLGVLLEALPGRQLEALSHYQRSVAIDPSYAAAQNNLAAALVRSGHPNEAVSHFEAALRLEPQSAALSGNLGSTLVMCGRYAEAVPYYRRALAINPEDAATKRNLAWVLQKLGR